MGNCCGSQLFHVNQTLNKSGHLSSARRSQSTSNTTSKRISNGSGTSQFLEESLDEDDLKEQILTTPDIKEFTLQELKVATRNFRNDVLLGEGGFGKVYKGMLNSSGEAMVVAIKKLRSDSYQGFDEWQSEVNFLGRLSHPNLVRLLGYCWEERELLLVYEFMQHGSLEHHLFGNGRVIAVSPLPWELRLKIAIGAARGLAFLHATDRRVIYRDFKTSNLLLDREYNAKLSDFGLAKIGPSTSQSHLMTKVMGTYGYAAPEYVNTGRLYMKSDVYAFGVVLVEILTGIRAFDKNRPHSRRNLADWVKPYLSCKRKLRSIIDGRLAGRYPAKAAAETAQLALKCLAQEPKNRPEMQQVVDALERIQANHTIPQHGQESWHHLFACICTRSST